MRRARLLAAAISVPLAACNGVSPQSEPAQIHPETVPFELLEDPNTEPSPPDDLQHQSFVVYLVGEPGLVAVPRERPPSPSPAQIVRSLLTGPTESEAGEGLRSFIPPGVELRDLRVQAGVATIDLAGEFDDPAFGQDSTIALAQIVHTTTQFGSIQRVRFELDGRPVEVPRADGTLTRRPVGPDDYPNQES